MLVSLLLLAGYSQEPMPQLSARVLLTILVTTVSAGCSYALGSHALIDGREYHRDHVASLSRGMSEAEVRSLIGEPTEQSTGARRVTWRYHAVFQQRACEVTLFGIIPVERRPKEQYDVTLVFGAQGLEAARYVERLPERTTTTDLLAKSRQ
jgi:outer membrane protein assembly factor BamE (lipoprotein component of BamABCDE complex)